MKKSLLKLGMEPVKSTFIVDFYGEKIVIPKWKINDVIFLECDMLLTVTKYTYLPQEFIDLVYEDLFSKDEDQVITFIRYKVREGFNLLFENNYKKTIYETVEMLNSIEDDKEDLSYMNDVVDVLKGMGANDKIIEYVNNLNIISLSALKDGEVENEELYEEINKISKEIKVVRDDLNIIKGQNKVLTKLVYNLGGTTEN